MKATFISLALLIAATNWVNGAVGLPTLQQPRYFLNNTVEWFPKIIGGSVVQLDSTNGQVSIQNGYGHHLCSGTLISLKTVLTAAACMVNQNVQLFHPTEIRIIADETDLSGGGNRNRQIGYVENYYIRSTSGLAILELVNSFTASLTLKYRAISNDSVKEDQECYVTGWGASPVKPNIQLQTVPLKALSNAVTNSSKYFDSAMPRGTISATYLSLACFGDLGSALICADAVSGVLAFGYGCNNSDFPLIFYRSYDDDIVRDNNRRGGGSSSGSSGGSSGGSNGGSSGGSSGGSGGNKGGSGGIIILPGGGNRPTECTNENGNECGGAASITKHSAVILLFLIIQYFFNKLVNNEI